MESHYIIGIAGGSGSGKSTFANRLKESFANDVAIVSCDNYYLPRDYMPLEDRKKVNYDSPDAIEFGLLAEHIRRLKQGYTVNCPVYDFTQHTRSNRIIQIEPKPVIIVDGILILIYEELRKLFDLKVYVDTDADERILRRAKRDIQERGRDFDSVISQYLSTVKPMHNLYVEPTKVYSDIIIIGGKNDVAFDLVKTKVKSVINRE